MAGESMIGILKALSIIKAVERERCGEKGVLARAIHTSEDEIRGAINEYEAGRKVYLDKKEESNKDYQ